MNSEYKYRYILTSEEKNVFRLMLAKDKSINEICNTFKVSRRFVKYKYLEYRGNPHPISFGSKTDAYYKNEMEYGRLNLNYNYNEVKKEKTNTKRTPPNKG